MVDQVYLIIYNDPEDGSVEVDVYKQYERAVDRFNKSLNAAKEAGADIAEHLEDTEWSFPYYRTVSGYEVMVRAENIQ